MKNSDTIASHYNMESSNTLRKQTLHNLLHSHGTNLTLHSRDPSSPRSSQASLSPTSTTLSLSPLSKSPWSTHIAPESENLYSYTGLIGSLIREEGHVYSLAASKEILYTGSESKNIRVWKNHKELSSFKSSSGLVKTIIIYGNRIFSGHQDGKIRVWKALKKDPTRYKRIGSMPTFKARVKNTFSINSCRNSKWVQHTDTISCLSLSEDGLLLYSASWDQTFKVWRVADSKCLESVAAHDDVVNAIVTGFNGLVFTGSADGSVKVWQQDSKSRKHFLAQTLLKQEYAVTALAVDQTATFLYCGSSNGTVYFWEQRKVLCHGGILKGHKLAVLCLATAGNLVFSGSADSNICVWRREEGRHTCLSMLIGHTGPVKCLAVEEAEAGEGDQRYTVYSGGIDKSVKIWRVSTQAEAAAQGKGMWKMARN